MKVYARTIQTSVLVKEFITSRLIPKGCHFVVSPEMADIIVVQVPDYRDEAYGLHSRFPRKKIYTVERLQGNGFHAQKFHAPEVR